MSANRVCFWFMGIPLSSLDIFANLEIVKIVYHKARLNNRFCFSLITLMHS
mgnify:CR=1 FL=1